MSHDELEERMMISQMKGIFTMQPLLKGIWFDEIWKHSIKKKEYLLECLQSVLEFYYLLLKQGKNK